jgi:hypothetical protein
MRTSRTLHVFGVAALSLALVGSGGSVHARRGPSEPLSAAAIDQVTCSEPTPRRMIRAATFKAEVLPPTFELEACDAKGRLALPAELSRRSTPAGRARM